MEMLTVLSLDENFSEKPLFVPQNLVKTRSSVLFSTALPGYTLLNVSQQQMISSLYNNRK